MSDEDAAKGDKNTDAEPKADAERPEGGTGADVTAGDDSGASKSESAQSTNSEDETVKHPIAPDPAPSATGATGTEAAASQQTGGSSGGGGSNWKPIAAAFAAGVVLVAAVTAVVVFALQASSRGDELDTRKEATNAACDFGRQVGTYDAKNFDDYVKRVKDRSTGDWGNQFDAASSALKNITTQAQARSGVDEIHCAWESGDDNNATVLMLITQNQSKAATPQPQKMTIGVVATMEHKDGKWLASKFDSPMMDDQGGGSGGAAPGGAAAGGAQPGQAPMPQPGG